MNSGIHVLNPNMETIPLDSTITIEDTESETDMIELDSSCDTDIACLDGNPIYDPKNNENSSPIDDIDATNDEVTTHSSKDLQSVSSNDDVRQPIFKVMFRDESVSRQYRQQIKDFLHSLVQLKPSNKQDVNVSSLILEVWDNKDSSKDQELSIDIEDNNALNDSTENTDVCDSLFMIDKKPTFLNDLDVPTYGQKYEDITEESNSVTRKGYMPKLNCFNCNGNHNFRDCPLPKNQNNINKNRKEFMKNNSGVRYHMSEDQRFSHMIPGQLSHKLRKALGLKDNQLPKHIYRMRLLGYPPGWLEEARLQHSGLSLFNSDGIAETDPNEEEGEIITDIDRDQYDIKKIYDFPGFNVPSPPGTIDDSHKYRAPKIQPMHSKEIMLLYLQGKKTDDGYKRKKLKLSTSIVNALDMSSDMDIEDTGGENVVENVPVNGHFIPPLPTESVQTPPAPPPSELFQSITEDSDSQSQELPSLDSVDDIVLTANSPSLSDLESTKKKLLIELEDNSSQSNSGSTSLKNDLNNTFAAFSSIAVTAQSNCSSISQECSNADKDSIGSGSQFHLSLNNELNSKLDMSIPNETMSQFSSTPILSSKFLNTSQTSVKSVHLGTPILQSTSPYNKLPSSEKFSKDICDVINFENLPDTTGKYEQMTGVLQKVRNTMARLHQ
ncbi:Zinc finger CCHC domain-containing protein 8 [Camponotus floridanus]|uniref:Zinc finger CCHC domain-containing protein 8 n=1 Tax=Camponotus floridanus TaxID=104421 RepID=E1ZXA2_CAMFO|nr:zinc finger CCHC domain-containing protein 8 homolog [Camponotus floridanus]EFN74192.1 Zinc finger CCHC domain-containing protein 8 [Camponotus floridanus]